MPFVQPRLSSVLGVLLALIVTLGVFPLRKDARGEGANGLFLLSGTITNYGDEAFPVALFGVDFNRKLRALREVVPQAEGLYSVHQAADVIFVAHPHIAPTTVTIVHMDEPLRPDQVVFNPDGLTSIQSREGLAEPMSSRVNELFPLVTDQIHPNQGTVVAVSGIRTAGGPRVKSDAWDEYAAFRLQGDPGGAALTAGRFGSVVDRKVVISVFGRSIDVDVIPPFLRDIKKGTIAWLMVVSDRYSVLSFAETDPTRAAMPTGTTRRMFVHNREKNEWKRIEIEGSKSRLRIFGSWLATVVAMENPDHRPSPGRQNERNWGTARLPNIQMEYENLMGRESWLPGILVLQNLADGRKIRIETGQEDSEILRVEGDVVLYRVNDTIYQARIDGSQLKDTTVIVKDEDVPEVHWVFWSK